MEKAYDHKKVEKKIYELWEKGGHFKPKSDTDPNFKGEKFVIPIPPPNVTGRLHIGHAYMLAIEDAMIRYKRMQGFDTLWVPGTDHAGISTQNVVEKKLALEGKTRHDLGREAMIKEIWKWKEEYHKNISSQIRAMGASADWSRERFTLDEGLSTAVKHAFVTLYDRGLIYKGEYMVNWCPRCMTVLADDEVEHEDLDGSLWYFRYPLKENPKETIIVATTRPETMLGDTAVAVNPKDKRYKALIGKVLLLPIANREILIIGDSHVDMDFGTGAVKVTPAHDVNDYEIAKRHNLPFIKVISDDATMTKEAGDYFGFDRYEARKAITEELGKLGLLEKKIAHEHSVGHCYRCHTVIEPLLSKQWFVKTTILSQKATKSLKDKELTILPKRFEKIYTNWLENMRDWCISRQLWWGHQIPAWYCEDCDETVVAEEEPKKCTKCASTKLKRDPDVLDTWFSSSLWPFSILGWPEKTTDFNKFYPTSVLETGYDIIFFWVARMTMMGLELTGKSPFETVYLHGLIRDEKGRKMSKSLGNVVEPLEIIEEFGADSLRFTYLVGSTPGNDANLSMDKIKGNRNFNNKIWNIARYISSDSSINEYNALKLDSDVDKWIVSRLQKVIKEVSTHNDKYMFSVSGETLYSFIWNEFADWYVELSKTKRNNSVLYYLMENVLRLLHPFNPYITEHLWELMGYKEKYQSLLISYNWPAFANKLVDEEAEKGISSIIEIIKGLRSFKSDQGIEPSTKFEALEILDQKEELKDIIDKNKDSLLKIARIEDLYSSKEDSKIKTRYLADGYTISIIPGAKAKTELSKVSSRLEKELTNKSQQLESIKTKLNNKKFVGNAPKEIVAREKENKLKLENEITHLKKSLKELS